MTEGTLISLFVAPGDAVEAGQEIYGIETTKIVSSVEAPAAGVLRRWVGETGQVLPIGALVGIITDEAVSDTEIDAFVAGFTVVENDSVGDRGRPRPSSVDVGGLRIAYQAVRSAGGDGAPLVLIHGFSGDLDNWLFNIDVLAESRPVYALDLPGHGGSSKVGGDLAMLAESVAGVLRALGLARVHLCGHSLGGAVALKLALDEPSRIQSLSLIAPAGLGDEINSDYLAGFLRADRHRTLGPVVELLFHDKSLVTRTLVESLLRSKRMDGAGAALIAIAAAQFPGGRQATNLRSRLPELSMPVLIVAGLNDEIIPVDHSARLPARFRVEMIPECGHMPHIEAARQVNTLLSEHLAAADLR